MLHVPTWARLLVLLILLSGLVIVMPNAVAPIPGAMQRYPSWLPQAHVNLGLDLQGGSYILLEVGMDQVYKDQVENLLGDIRVTLKRKAHIYFRFTGHDPEAVSVEILDPSRLEEARSLIADLNPSIGGGLVAVGTRAFDETVSGNVITMKMTETYKTQTRQNTVNESVEVVRRRIDELGTREPSIELQGDDRIIVQVPGLQDPTKLLEILQTTAKMTFQLVDETADPTLVAKGTIPIGSELLQQQQEKGGPPLPPIVVQKRIMVDGSRLVSAKADFSQQNGQSIVDFRFDTRGAQQFGAVTRDNVGHRFAIVLDKKVISAPVINTPILGGSGYIEGHFTSESANNLAVLLNAGALPAPLKPINQRSIGPEMGADQIRAGSISALAGLICVGLFMVARYGLFGLFANLALMLNIMLLLAVLTLFGATLTLPGIAGIVLTMGMAVDANVLIFERIREEQRNGRSMLASIDQGFQRARTTIFDANFTHLIASLILFELGSGPVRGFAVTLGVGILTSFFTAVMVTRLIVITWLNVRRPKRLTI